MILFSLFRRRGAANTFIEGAVPKHVAFIMDGNQRWARRRGRPAFWGHQQGAKVIETVARHLFDRGVQAISLYTFSVENWGRPKEEVDFLMKLIADEMPAQIKRAQKEGVRIRFIGRRDRVPKKIIRMFEKAEKDTAENTRGTLAFAIDYSGQDEIIRATNAAIEMGASVDAEGFETFMDTGDLLPIDLVVRTSGEQRVSNFMLWKLAYAELVFISEDWPDMNDKILDRILADFTTRKRRFGK